MMLKIISDTLLDNIKLLPFLFLTYLLMEVLEHKAGEHTRSRLKHVGTFGPLWGGFLGILPQCGFSAAASSLYSGHVITIGTLLAIFLSTSDEMLPIFLSEAVPILTILKILGVKVVIAIISGFFVEAIYITLLHKKEREMDIHTFCEEEHCHCEDGLLLSAFKHTLRIFVYIFLISFVLNVAIQLMGTSTLNSLFTSIPVAGQLVSALIGLIPNCASSVIITQLYLDGIINSGSMMSGLLVNAGVGLLVLFRLNHNIKQNAAIVGVLYALGVFWGIVINLSRIVF